MVHHYLERRNIGEEEIMMNSVSVKMLEINWLKSGNKTYLDLFSIFLDQKNIAIYRTKFFNALLLGYWDHYYQKIYYQIFIPFVAYMFGIMTFFMYALHEDTGHIFFEIFYYPLLGYVLIL